MERTDDSRQFELTIRTGSEELRLQGTVPLGPLTLTDLVPMLQQLDDLIVAATVRGVEAEGATVSCGPGCGVCCRQLVPISEPEALCLASVVHDMPPRRRARVVERFAAALEALEETGILQRMLRSEPAVSIDDTRAFGGEYFRLGLACPFLENESCSIHPDRPLVCREYLVTSPAERCAAVGRGVVAGIMVPNKLSSFLHSFGNGPDGREVVWMPLTAALRYADAAPAPASFPGPWLIEGLVAHLSSGRPRPVVSSSAEPRGPHGDDR
jgi:Fe-S-cluster containining protein